MKKFILPLISDILSVAVISFILCFLIVNYFTQGTYAYLIAIFSSIAITLLIGRKIYNKYTERFTKGIASKKYKEVMLQLNFNNRQKNDALFYKALKEKYSDTEKTSSHVILPSQNSLVFTRFNFEEIVKGDIVKIYNKLGAEQNAVVYAESFSTDVEEFAKQFNGRISLKAGKDAYELLESTNNFPDLTFSLLDSVKQKRFSIGNVLSRKRAKTFLCFGALFILMSYFVPLKTYYVVSGVIMLIISAICIVFGRTSSPKTDHAT